ncbi:MAG: hypothetical protein U5K27_01960 [Desulfotignum sp.]|nr:hypothetical protein [Desulfotignum sp.]
MDKGIAPEDFNSYGSRRGNHEVMMRGTFGNIRIKNQMVSPTEGSFTKKLPEGTDQFIYDASMAYMQERHPFGRSGRQRIRHRFLQGLGGKRQQSSGYQSGYCTIL